MKKTNATHTESRHYDNEELITLAYESKERAAPAWVSRGLLEQVDNSAE